VPDSSPLTNGTAYFASQTVNGCESTERISITDSILPCIYSGRIAITNLVKSIPENDTLSFITNFFISSFSDSDGYSLNKIKILSLPAHGNLNLSGVPVMINDEISVDNIGNLTFIPKTNWYGSSNFGWNGSDGIHYALMSALVRIIVTPVKHPPTLVSDTLEDTIYSRGGTKTIDLTNNIINLDGDTLATSILIQPKHGKTIIEGSGQLVYTPDSSYIGKDTVTYQVCNNAEPPECVTGEVVFSDTGRITSIHIPVISTFQILWLKIQNYNFYGPILPPDLRIPGMTAL